MKIFDIIRNLRTKQYSKNYESKHIKQKVGVRPKNVVVREIIGSGGKAAVCDKCGKVFDAGESTIMDCPRCGKVWIGEIA